MGFIRGVRTWVLVCFDSVWIAFSPTELPHVSQLHHPSTSENMIAKIMMTTRILFHENTDDHGQMMTIVAMPVMAVRRDDGHDANVVAADDNDDNHDDGESFRATMVLVMVVRLR